MNNKMPMQTPHEMIRAATMLAAAEDDNKHGKEFALKVSEHTTAVAIAHWPREMCEYVDERFNRIHKRKIELLFGNLTDEQQKVLVAAVKVRSDSAFHKCPSISQSSQKK